MVEMPCERRREERSEEGVSFDGVSGRGVIREQCPHGGPYLRSGVTNAQREVTSPFARKAGCAGNMEGPTRGRGHGGGSHKDLLSKRVMLPEAAIGMTERGGSGKVLSQRKLLARWEARSPGNRPEHIKRRATRRNEGAQTS